MCIENIKKEVSGELLEGKRFGRLRDVLNRHLKECAKKKNCNVHINLILKEGTSNLTEDDLIFFNDFYRGFLTEEDLKCYNSGSRAGRYLVGYLIDLYYKKDKYFGS